MVEFLRNYGAVIGPSLAFILGMFTLYMKQHLDRTEETRKARRTFVRFFDDIKNFDFPSTFYPNKSEDGFLHADQARNRTNLSRYYSKLLMYRHWIDAIEKNVYLHGSGREIRIFNQIIWFSKFQVERIEAIRNDGLDYGAQEYMNLRSTHEAITAGLHGGDDMSKYISDLKAPSS